MAKDIVVQLKDLAASTNRGGGKSTIYGAASEIERLRVEIKDLQLSLPPVMLE
jgi:archaellum component FlaC